jgi:hypothetical protein
VLPDDNICCLKHEYGDKDLIPESLKTEIRNFFETEYIPTVFEYLGNIFPKYRRYTLFRLDMNGFDFPSIDDGITPELAYELTLTEDFLCKPDEDLNIIEGKTAIGAIMRVCKTIGKQELADNIFQVVKNFFNPDEHPDPNDPLRELFVAPSMEEF